VRACLRAVGSRKGAKAAKKTISRELSAIVSVNLAVLRIRPSPTTIRRLKVAVLVAAAILVYIKGGEYFAVLAFRLFLKFFPADFVLMLILVGYWRDQFKGR
jgi:hypothetical protein